MRFADYMEENCFFWINTSLFALFISSVYIAKDQHYMQYLTTSIAILFFCLIMLLIGLVIHSDGYINSIKEIGRYCAENWVSLINFFATIVILVFILIFLNWKAYMNFDIMSSFKVAIVLCMVYSFLFYKNINLFTGDFKNNGVKYLSFLLVFMAQIFFVSYVDVNNLIFNDLVLNEETNLFEKFVESVNIFSFITAFLILLCIYFYVLYKKIKIFFMEVILDY